MLKRRDGIAKGADFHQRKSEIVVRFRVCRFEFECFAIADDRFLRETLFFLGDTKIIVRVRLGRVDRQCLLVSAYGSGKISRIPEDVAEIAVRFGVARIQRDGLGIRGHSILGSAGPLRNDPKIEPVHGRGSLLFDGGMEIFQGFGETLLPVGHEAEQVERFGMVRGEIECLPVGGFRLEKTTGLLMHPALIEPGFDRRRGAGSSNGFLTTSLGSIHDASGSRPRA